MPQLGNRILGDIYYAITGTKRLPRVLGKRAIAAGLDEEQVNAIFKQAKSSEEVEQLLSSLASDRLQKGMYWYDVGVKNRARDHYLESSLWDIMAALVSTASAQRSKSFERAQDSYALAAPNFQNPAEAVEIAYLSGKLNGYLRLPTSKIDESVDEPFIDVTHPCVILLNGISAPKEELHLTENALLAVGCATLSFDYPAQVFDDSAQSLMAFDVDELGSALTLFLESRPEIDSARLALHGTSIGGRLAVAIAASVPDKYRALCITSTPYDLLTETNLLVPAMRRELAASASCTKAAILDLARRTSMASSLSRLQTPALVIGGGKDVIATAEEARLTYEQCGSSDKKLVICSSAGHNCYEMMPSLRHEIAQWIRQRL